MQAPPELTLHELGKLESRMGDGDRVHVWVELLDRVVRLHLTDPATSRICRSAHVGIYSRQCSVARFLEAVQVQVEKLWRVIPREG